MKDIITLAVESSCDETSVAVLKNGREVLSNIINTQVDLHKKFGGVVPEVASRNHIENIDVVLQEALDKANTDKTTSATKSAGSQVSKSVTSADKNITSATDGVSKSVGTF